MRIEKINDREYDKFFGELIVTNYYESNTRNPVIINITKDGHVIVYQDGIITKVYVKSTVPSGLSAAKYRLVYPKLVVSYIQF